MAGTFFSDAYLYFRLVSQGVFLLGILTITIFWVSRENRIGLSLGMGCSVGSVLHYSEPCHPAFANTWRIMGFTMGVVVPILIVVVLPLLPARQYLLAEVFGLLIILAVVAVICHQIWKKQQQKILDSVLDDYLRRQEKDEDDVFLEPKDEYVVDDSVSENVLDSLAAPVSVVQDLQGTFDWLL